MRDEAKVLPLSKGIEPEQVKSTVTDLIDEANALKQWLIPPNADVQLSFGPFTHVELTEKGSDVYFVWRDEYERFFITSMNPRTGDADTHERALTIKDDVVKEKVDAAFRLVMAALIRDFWVVTEREKVFAVVRQRRGEKAERREGPRFVYLPRCRYTNSPSTDRVTERLEHVTRSRHFVQPFMRRANPSHIQCEIARRDRVELPPGYTYVRGHYRGGGESHTIYRSRSALQLLYEAHEVDEQLPPDSRTWFDFERDLAVLLERLGFEVVHRSTPGKTDDGIDVLANKLAKGEIEDWLVQAKFYDRRNSVGVSVVRELVGAIQDYQQRHEAERVRGMIVTTSQFSPDARNLAIRHDIQLLDGPALADVCAAENAREN